MAEAGLSHVVDWSTGDVVRRAWARCAVYLELGKARLSVLVLLTTAVGYRLASTGALDWGRFGWTLLGTALAALGANACNQWLERVRDGRMDRTQGRPLPTRQISSPAALAFAVFTGAGGVFLLATRVNELAALLALTTYLLYVVLYTPLKTQTTLNTLVGAVVGALPPMIGWAGATGQLDVGAWVLGGILFVWQIPHFLALAWLYRKDYRRGGMRMLPVLDEAGHLTACVVVVYTLVLVPMTLMLTAAGITGTVYAVGSLLLSGGFLLLAVRLERQCSAVAARRVFLASIAYLPLLLGLMVLDQRALPDVDPRIVHQPPAETRVEST